MNPIFYDLIILAILLVFTLLGRKKGFILSLCDFLAMFVALIGAAVLTNLLAPPLSQLLVPLVQGKLGESLGQFYAETGANLQAVLTQALSALEDSPIFASLLASAQSAAEAGLLDATADAAQSLTLYVAQQLTRLILFPLFFVAILLIWKLMSRALDLAFRLPGLHFLNRTLGLLLGFSKGLLLVFILCWFLKDSYLPPQVIRESFLLPFFCSSNPLLYLSILNS